VYGRIVLTGMIVLAVGACSTSVEGSGVLTSVGDDASGDTTTTFVEVDYGPFLVDDPFDVVIGMSWLELSPTLEQPIESGGPVAVLMDDSTRESLHVAVNGGGCRPRVRISVLQPPPGLELGMQVGEGIAPPGLACADILTTHGFEVLVAEPASLDEVVFTRMLFEEPNLDR